MQINQIQQKQLNEILEKSGVQLAYIFGSFAKDKVGPLSDLDIAVLFSKEVSEKEYFDRELKLSSQIGSFFKINRVDIINLGTVNSPLLKHNAVFRGKIIFGEDSRNRFELEKRIMQEYEDTKHLRETQYYYLEKHIKEGVFGKGKFSPTQEKIFNKYVHR